MERYGGSGNLNVKQHQLRVTWGRPKPQGPQSELKAAQNTTSKLIIIDYY
jgi:hypothetical protein